MRLLFLFLDGIGLGANDPVSNPFAKAHLPNLQALLGGDHLVYLENMVVQSERATLIPMDACLGVAGLPQSATGQATLLTGQNIPAALGYHYGPKPDPAVTAYINNGNLFHRLQRSGKQAALLNAYPPRYFQAIESGRRLPGAIAMAAYRAGMSLKTLNDLSAGEAISADFTGLGWRNQLGFSNVPLLTLPEAGMRLAMLASQVEFTLFEYWLTDIAGHKQDMHQACSLLESFDQVLGSLLAAWDDTDGLILLTSDHGNLEDLSTRRHTFNRVPALIIGRPQLRDRFVRAMIDGHPDLEVDLTRITPSILEFLDAPA